MDIPVHSVPRSATPFVLTAFIQATAALTLSGLAILALVLLLAPPLFPEHSLRVERWYPNPTAPPQDNASEWVFPTLPTHGYAMAQAMISPLTASDYPFLQVHIEGRSAETEVAVIWSTDTQSAAINKYPLPWSSGTLSVLDLGSIRQWRGRVLHLGIAISGQAPGPVRIRSLEVVSPSALVRVQAAWSAATAFEGWHPYSINFAYGGSPANWPIGPLAVTAWVILASLLLALFQWLRGTHGRLLPLSMIMLCGWGLLDARWQLDLTRQHARTLHEYAGRSVAGKRADGEDGPLFRFILSAKALMPKPPQRVLLIPDAGDTLRAAQLRASYYLRPHNVYAEDLRPLCQGALDAGDYVLALGTHPSLQYVASTRRLSWSGCPALPAERLASTTVGQLFRIGDHSTL